MLSASAINSASRHFLNSSPSSRVRGSVGGGNEEELIRLMRGVSSSSRRYDGVDGTGREEGGGQANDDDDEEDSATMTTVIFDSENASTSREQTVPLTTDDPLAGGNATDENDGQQQQRRERQRQNRQRRSGSGTTGAEGGGRPPSDNNGNDNDENATNTSEEHQGENEQQEEDNDDEDDAIISLARRLRCLFTLLTWPIVPLGTLLSISLLWVIYTAFITDSTHQCSFPLHLYAASSLALFLYTPQHSRLKRFLFNYNRERDGPVRPRGVRMFDQLYHTVCLLYVYGGMTLIQRCKDDITVIPDDDGMTTVAASGGGEAGGDGTDGSSMNGTEGTDTVSAATSSSSVDDFFTTKSHGISTCEATCPSLYRATSVYVLTLELFAFTLLLPLICLPCVYVWIVRRAVALAQLRTRRGGDEYGDEYGETVGFTADEILDSMEQVQLVRKKGRGSTFNVCTKKKKREREHDGGHNNLIIHEGIEQEDGIVGTGRLEEEEEETATVRLVRVTVPGTEEGEAAAQQSTSGTSRPMDGSMKECCICMMGFRIYDEDEVKIINGGGGGGKEAQRRSSVNSLDNMSTASVAGSSYQRSLGSEEIRDIEIGRVEEVTSSSRSPPLSPQERDNTVGDSGEQSSTAATATNVVTYDDDAMVRTKCGHVFHRSCLGGWLGGRWGNDGGGSGDDNRATRRTRRARRKCCPLCREDLTPPQGTETA